jgi:hypothetical protein
VERDLIIMHALCSAAAKQRSDIEAGLGRGPPQTSGLEPREKQFPSRRSFVLSRRRRCIKRRGALVPWIRGHVCKLFGWWNGAGSCSAGSCSAASKGLHACSAGAPKAEPAWSRRQPMRTSRDQ